MVDQDRDMEIIALLSNEMDKVESALFVDER